MTRLVIQTNLAGERHLWLTTATGKILKQHHARHQHHAAHLLLRNVDPLIAKRKPNQIVVVRGPGPFTAIRAALVVANTLGWVWDISVSGVVRHTRLTDDDLKFEKLKFKKNFTQGVRPWYGRGPNISIAKARPKLTQFRKRP